MCVLLINHHPYFFPVFLISFFCFFFLVSIFYNRSNLSQSLEIRSKNAKRESEEQTKSVN